MSQQDECIEVPDGQDAVDLGSVDVIADDAGDSWIGRHRRATAAGVVVAVLVVVAGASWKATHPPTLAVPDISVAVDERTGSLSPSAPLFEGSSLSNPRFVLAVSTGDHDDVQVSFERLSGTGVSMPRATPVLVRAGTSRLTVRPTVDCDAWHGSQALVASFRVTDGVLAQTVAVHVDSPPSSVADAAVTRACAAYRTRHPIGVVNIASDVDPVLPVVHLSWTLRNYSRHPWPIVGQSIGVSFSKSPMSPIRVTPTVLPASSTQTVTSSVSVDDCANPGSFATTILGFELSAVHKKDQTDVRASSQDVAKILAQARRACSGAPAVTGVRGVVTVSGRGSSATGVIAVHAQVAGTALWDASVGMPQWWVDFPATAPFPTVTGIVAAPGDVNLVVRYPFPTCADPVTVNELRLRLRSGQRWYPFTVPLVAAVPWVPVGCVSNPSTS